jgi:hypothetical protein
VGDAQRERGHVRSAEACARGRSDLERHTELQPDRNAVRSPHAWEYRLFSVGANSLHLASAPIPNRCRILLFTTRRGSNLGRTLIPARAIASKPADSSERFVGSAQPDLDPAVCKFTDRPPSLPLRRAAYMRGFSTFSSSAAATKERSGNGSGNAGCTKAGEPPPRPVVRGSTVRARQRACKIPAHGGFPLDGNAPRLGHLDFALLRDRRLLSAGPQSTTRRPRSQPATRA